MLRRSILPLAVLAVLIGVANFLWAGLDITRAGGVPNEVTVAGVYQVSNHGDLTTVDKQTYDWLQFHLQTVLVTQVLFVGAMVVLVLRLSKWVKTGT